jgi:hypothetical protein
VLVSQLGGGGNLRAALYNWIAGGPATLVSQSNNLAAALGLRTIVWPAALSLILGTRYYIAVGTTSNGLQLAAIQSGTILDGQATAFCVRDINNFIADAFPATLNLGTGYQFPFWGRLRV